VLKYFDLLENPNNLEKTLRIKNTDIDVKTMHRWFDFFWEMRPHVYMAVRCYYQAIQLGETAISKKQHIYIIDATGDHSNATIK
jgi:hypothetical protein